MDSTKLEELIKKVEDAKNRRAKLEGAMEQLNQRMKTEFNCNTLEELDAFLKKQQDLLADLDKQISEESAILEGMVTW